MSVSDFLSCFLSCPAFYGCPLLNNTLVKYLGRYRITISQFPDLLAVNHEYTIGNWSREMQCYHTDISISPVWATEY